MKRKKAQTQQKPNYYVDGFVFVVPEKNLSAYKKMAALGGKIWKKHGALAYRECVQDDMYANQDVPANMRPIPFPKLTKAKEGELVCFSYIVFKSRKHRDQVNAKVMKDPAMNDPKYANQPMPFEMKRMAYGGFKTIVSE